MDRLERRTAMLKIRVIPTLLWKNHGLVKGVGFDSWRRVGTVLPAIKVYNLREVDEMMVLDISATLDNREPDYDSVMEFSSECFVPLTVGGGIKNIDQIRRLLLAGADKVSINSAAYENPTLIREAAYSFGSQCVVVSIDVRKHPDGRYECYSHSGTRPTGIAPETWAEAAEEFGAGEILLTSVERDGTMLGYDIDLIERVNSRVSIPVIASGGAGSYQDMLDVLIKGHASAVAAASIFHFTQQTPLEAKRHLARAGLAVRNAGQL
jgi:cyclase